jgi:SPP1 gp7 family putative phage head morphogenesis protein
LDAISQIVTGSAQRLWRYSDEFIDKAKEEIISGMVAGRGYRQVARALRVAKDLTRYQAERIVRTETVSASDDARRDMYRGNGVEYVQRYTAQDRRVCGYCVARAGNVYLATEAPAALHPNDRCYNLPWKPEWVGTRIATGFARDHKRDSRQLAKEQGVQPNFGPAPFERMNNLPVPQAVRVA